MSNTTVETSTPIELPVAAPRKIRFGQILVLALVLALLGLVAFQMRRNGPLAAGPVGQGQAAPEFTLTTFAGETYALADLRGQIVVVNFWASWCIPCEEEAFELENTWRHYKDQGVVFIGVDYVDTETEALAFIRRFDLTYPNGADLGTRISQAYRIRGVPETYIVNQSGLLAKVFIGPTTQSALTAVIESLLKQ